MSVATERLSCPVEGCEETFYDRSGLGRHLTGVHKIKHDSAEYRRLMGLRSKNAARSEQKTKTSYTHEVEQRLQETLKPLRDQLRGINQRLSEIDIEGLELRAARKRIEQVVRQLDPTSFVAAPKRRGVINASHVGSDETREAKRQAVIAFLKANRDKYEDGIVAAVVYRDMKAAGVTPVSAPNKVLEAIEGLHADGVLRADKKVRGGAMQYKFMSNGEPDGT